MKAIILLFVFLLASSMLAQDLEPGQHKFYFFGDSLEKYLSSDSSYFKQRNFMLGWHWGAHKKITQALDVKQVDGDRNSVLTDLVEVCDVFVRPVEYSHAVDSKILNARAIQWEPTLNMDSTNPEKLVIRQGDTTRPVFGFLHRRGRLLTSTSDPNFNRLIIDGDSLNGLLILDKPWPSDKMAVFGEGQDSVLPETLDTFLGRWLYFSINLRRLDNNTINDTLPLLKIELPYTKGKLSTRYLMLFDSIPSNIVSDTFSLTNNRGLIRRLMVAPSNAEYFYIYKNMVPPNNKDITISAFFKCDKTINPYLKIVAPDTGRIESIGIKITYMGNHNCPIAIDWVRIETPHAQRFLRGYYDDTITSNVQLDINKFTDTSFTNRNMRMFRYNTIIEGSLFNWIAEKYFNKLIGNISTNEVGVLYPQHYEYYVNPPDRWLGLYKIESFVSAPYSRKVYPSDSLYKARTIGIFNGYNGINNGNIESDPGKSHYETYLFENSSEIPIAYFIDNPDSLEQYIQAISYGENSWRASYLVKWENNIYMNYFKKESEGFLYSDKFWWNQNFIHIQWGDIAYQSPIDPNRPTSAVYGLRPYTGEEFRLSTSLPLITGAKGLLYDGAESEPSFYSKTQFYDYGCIDTNTRKFLDSLPDLEFLNSDLAGPDFIRQSNEILDFNRRLYYLDSLAKFMDRQKEKLYIGRRSLRLEMKKIHDWIRAVEDTLMNLRLQCFWAKGYKKWYSQNPIYSYNLFSKYIDTNNIRTRHPLSENYEGTSRYNYSDSSFYDLTILKDIVNDSLMQNTIYLGADNRRTNPLILINDTLQFFSTAELEDSCKISLDSLLYQSYWWKRLGCRELTIPFNYNNTPNQFDGFILRVNELGVNDSTLNAQRWRDSIFYHKIDTVITEDGSVVMKMLPGEGKILKVGIENLVSSFPDSSEGLPCEGCAVINDSSQFDIVLTQQLRSEADSICCWELNLINNSSCTFTNLPIDIDLQPENFNSATFTSSQWASNTFSNEMYSFYYAEGVVNPNENVTIGTICIPENENFSLTVKVGKLFGENIFSCDRVWTFNLNCPCPENICCDEISIKDTTMPIEVCYQQIQECCNTISIDISDRYKRCCNNIYVIKAVTSGSQPPDPGIIPTNPINFSINPYTTNLCFDALTNPCGIYCQVFKIYFFDGDGNVICIKEDSVCCDFSDEQGRGGGYGKTPADDEPALNNNYFTDTIKIEELYCVPNPAENKINIEYRLNRTANVLIEIINSFGNIVNSMSNINNKQVTNSINFDTSLLPSGLYYIKLKAENEYKTIGIIIMH